MSGEAPLVRGEHTEGQVRARGKQSWEGGEHGVWWPGSEGSGGSGPPTWRYNQWTTLAAPSTSPLVQHFLLSHQCPILLQLFPNLPETSLIQYLMQNFLGLIGAIFGLLCV